MRTALRTEAGSGVRPQAQTPRRGSAQLPVSREGGRLTAATGPLTCSPWNPAPVPHTTPYDAPSNKPWDTKPFPVVTLSQVPPGEADGKGHSALVPSSSPLPRLRTSLPWLLLTSGHPQHPQPGPASNVPSQCLPQSESLYLLSLHFCAPHPPPQQPSLP